MDEEEQDSGIPVIESGTLAAAFTRNRTESETGPSPLPVRLEGSPLNYNFPYFQETPLFGRRAHYDLLREWWQKDPAHPMMVLTGVTGSGKTSLAWNWANTSSSNNPDIPHLWWQLHPQDGGIRRLLEKILATFGEKLDPQMPFRAVVDRALYHLHRSPMTLIIDEAEPLLRAMIHQPDVTPGIFLRRLTNPDQTSARVVLVSRWLPQALARRQVESVRTQMLAGLAPIDAYHYFNDLGLRVRLSDLIEIGERLHYHPFSLRLLAGSLMAGGNLKAIVGELEYGDDPLNWSTILPWAIEQLPLSALRTLHEIARMEVRASRDIVIERIPLMTVDSDLEQLVRRGLLAPLTHQRRRYYVVTQSVQRFLSQSKTSTIPKQGGAKGEASLKADPENVADARRAFEKLVQEERLDDAVAVFREYLIGWIDPDSGDPQTELALLGRLQPRRTEDGSSLSRANRAWVLQFMAERYAAIGQLALATQFLEQSNKLYEALEESGPLNQGQAQLARTYILMGRLAEADGLLRRSLTIAQNAKDRVAEAESRLELGYLLAICGHWAGSVRQMDAALELSKNAAHTQLQSDVWAYGGWLALLQGEAKAGLESVHEALRLLHERGATQALLSAKFIRLHWLLGWGQSLQGQFNMSKMHLDEAIRRAHLLGLETIRPAILVARAHMAHRKWRVEPSSNLDESAQTIGEQAVELATAIDSQLVLADAHLLLAELALDREDREGVFRHANEAFRFAECDGKPFSYSITQNRAMSLLSS